MANMNVEENRLLTFVNWPADAPIQPDRIAKGGFWATGASGVTKCFACGCYVANWSYGDQVMARHRALNAQCPFVLNPAASGNVPILPAPSTSSSDMQQSDPPVDDMSVESYRLATFRNWPAENLVSSQNLAKAGFYYLNENDRVRCFKCNGVCAKWELGDQPLEEHKRFFPHCEFIQSITSQTSRSTISTLVNKQLISRNNCQELGVQFHKPPHQSKYATLESRLLTFHGWPDELVQTPEVLAEAGFYYMGSNDAVRCFHCDGGLNRWDPHDEPWREHAKHFPTCGFLQLVKGLNFIKECSEDNSMTESLPDGSPNRSSGTVVFDRIRTLTDQELQVLMDSPVALVALGIGLHPGRVKQALKIKIESTGTGFSSADGLIEAALNVQLHEPNSLMEEELEEFNGVLAEVCRVMTQQRPQEMEPPTQEVEATAREQVAQVETKVVDGVQISLEEENRRLREARLCKICLDTEVGVVFLPCGHLATCINCAPSMKNCPVCRSPIKACVRTFLS